MSGKSPTEKLLSQKVYGGFKEISLEILSGFYGTHLDRVEFVDPRPVVIGISPECDLQGFQELVHAVQQGLRTEKKCKDRS